MCTLELSAGTAKKTKFSAAARYRLSVSLNSLSCYRIPVDDTPAYSPGNYIGAAPSADTSTSNLSLYERRVSEFNKIWSRRPSTAFRVTSWPDRKSARGDESPESRYRRSGGSDQHVRDGTVVELTYRSSGKGKKGPYRTRSAFGSLEGISLVSLSDKAMNAL